MTQPNDSTIVASGGNTTVAMHTPSGSKKFETVILADQSGDILGTKSSFFYNIASTVHVAVANTVMFDLFNADATAVIRVTSIRQIPNITTAVTGIVFDWKLARTSAVGTGGTTQTAWLNDLSGTALNSNVTCRLKPTGGATETTVLFNYSISSEETTAATIQIATQGGLELVPPQLTPTLGGQGILLRQNQGLRVVQITNSAAGNTAWIIGMTQE